MLNGYLIAFPILFFLSVGIGLGGSRKTKKTPKKAKPSAT